MIDNFWGKLNKPFTVLAPMANVTDWAFRQVVSETGTSTGLSINRPASARPKPASAWRRPAFAKASAGKPDVFYTEFVSCDGICAIGAEKFKGELYFEKKEKPIVAQFFTANPDHLKRCVALAVQMGFDGVDINMGCPDRSVEKQGAGAALIKNPELAGKLIKAAKEEAGRLPVSVKTRLGYNKIETDAWIPKLLETGLACLAVHARTRKEMSAVPAHWDEMEKIAGLARGSDTLIVGNGDIKDMNDVRQKAGEYGLDGIMVGRGIFTNPWFFTGKKIEDITPEERINLLIKHLDNFEKLWGGPSPGVKNFDVMKRFFKIYINNWPGAKEFRAKLMEVKNIDQARLLIKDFKIP